MYFFIVNASRQKELKSLGFLLQKDKEHFAVRFLSGAGNFTVDELKSININMDKGILALPQDFNLKFHGLKMKT